MDELALQVRTFIYTMICFQCLLQLSAGNSFYKYLKLFSQLLAISICCNIFLCCVGIVDSSWSQADKIYKEWEKQWGKEELLVDMDGYLESQIVEMSMSEFEVQITSILKEKGGENYILETLERSEDGWNIVLAGGQIQEKKFFLEDFKQTICEQYAIQEEQLEVTIK